MVCLTHKNSDTPKVFNDLKTRGCNDILIAVVDGLKGLVRIPANVTAESGERDRVARSGPAQDWIVG